MTMLKTILIVLVLLVPTAIYADKDSTKNLCERNGGDYTKNGCDFDDNDEDKADRFGEDHDKLRHFEEERAADEDALCEDSDAKFDICQSATLAFADTNSKNEETCSGIGGEWKDDRCRADIDSDDKDEIEQEQTYIDDAVCDNNSEKYFDLCQATKKQDATLTFASSDKDQCEDNGGNWNDNECNFEKLSNRSDKEACEENDGYWSKEEKSCNFDEDEDEPAHSDKGYTDWEYDEEDA